MRVLSLLYHDIVNRDLDGSGFPGAGPARYKLEIEDFSRHLEAVGNARPEGPIGVGHLRGLAAGHAPPLLLTFDDGGSSAVRTADLLDARGWRGHFLITVEPIGTRGFVTIADIRDLRRRGHTIGSHSFSHPDPMSGCPGEVLRREWGQSVRILEDILGESVDVASVPGGAYSREVARSAASAGIRALFTSEPVTKCWEVEGCLVLGRFNLWRGTPPRVAAALAAGKAAPRMGRFFAWNARKIAKTLGGKSYLRLRNALLARGPRRES